MYIQPSGERWRGITAAHCFPGGFFELFGAARLGIRDVPPVFTYGEPEQFFSMAQEMKPDGAVIDLSGVAGLNAVGYLRSLYPGCGLFWCSDLEKKEDSRHGSRCCK